MQVTQQSPEQMIAINRALDSILKEHAGHERYTDTCRLCIFSAALSVQRRDIAYSAAFLYLSDIDVAVVNDAIREVSTALDDYELVKPVVAGGKSL